MKVLQSFYDGATFTFYIAGTEIADDPSLNWAEKRGLVKKEKEAAEKEVKEKKPATKKTKT